MPHVDHYRNGKRLVSVTELQGIINKPFLEKWKQGLCAADMGLCGFVKAKQVAEEASDLGTKVHEYVERWLKKQDPGFMVGTEATTWATKVIELYISRNVTPCIIEPEETLVDEQSGLAGSPDHVVMWDGEPMIGDLKIKNQLDSFTAMQGVGYRYLINRLKKVDIAKMLVIHCDKRSKGKLVKPVVIDLDSWTGDWCALVKLWNRLNVNRKVNLSW